MRALVLTHQGLETTSAEEIKSLLKIKKFEIITGGVLFSVNTEQELADLCYHGRTFLKVVRVLSEETINGLPQKLPELKQYLGQTAETEVQREGTHGFTSFDAEQELNAKLVKEYKIKIDHKNPQTKIFVLIQNNNCKIGIDFAGVDLGRRDYRVFLGRESLKGTIAAGLLKIAQYELKHKMADPFCREGIIPIEAALMAANISPHKFCKEKLAFTKLPGRNLKITDSDKKFAGEIICTDSNFKYVSSAKKNAKIAGIVKAIQFSRTNLQWMDSKFEKQSIDRIVTMPLQENKRIPQKIVNDIYHQLFYQAEFLLKKSGKICVCMKRGSELIKEKAKAFKFEIEHERKIKQGKEEFEVILFKK